MNEGLTKERRLEACVQSMASRPDLPAFSHQVYEILSVAGDEDANMRRLTGLMLKNYSLTAKVLRTANSLYYNRAGRPILSVSHAIAYLGWNTIRDLAGGMLLFEHFSKDRNTPGVKELMLCSLLTANHARVLAARLHYPRIEEAYLCGMFRNLGEILVAAYLPERYAEILRGMRTHQWSETSACARVLSFDYEDLGRSILRYWNLPEKVGVAMAAPQPADILSDDTDVLRAMTDFSYLLSAAVYRAEPEQTAWRVQALIGKYRKSLGINDEIVADVLKVAAAETQATFEAARMPLDRLRLESQIESAMRTPVLPADDSLVVEAPREAMGAPDRDLALVVREVRSVLTSGHDFDLNDLMYMILEGIYRAGRFDRALLCLVTPERAEIEARLGVGEGIDALLASFRLPITPRGGPLAAALAGRQDLFVDTAADTRFVKRSAVLQLTGAGYFGLLPVVVDRVVIGCLYFDRLHAAKQPEEKEKMLLMELRDVAACALARHRQAPAA